MPEPVPPRKLLPLALLLVAAAVYGLLFQFNKLVRDEGLPELAYVFWQSLLAGVALLALARALGRRPRWDWPHLRFYLAIGFLGIAFPIWLFTNLAATFDPGLLTTVIALASPLTYLVSLVLRLEVWRWLAVLGVALGFAGVLVIVGPTQALPSPAHAGWYLLALLAPAGFALANVSAAILRPPDCGALEGAAGMALGAAAMTGVAVCLTGAWYMPKPAVWGIGDWAILGAALVSMAKILLFLELVRVAGPVFFAQFNYLAVVASIAWAWLIFGAGVDWSVWLALTVMVLGVLLVTLAGRRRVGAATPAGRLPADGPGC